MQLVGLQGVDLFVTYVCNRRICLLEFFILKKSNEKNGHRQAKRRTCTYKNINKIIIIIIIIIIIKQVKATAARV